MVLSMNAEEALELSKDIRFFGKILKDSAKTMNDALPAAKHVRHLVGGFKSGNLSSKLIKAGMTCIFFPEPLFSNIIGSTLVTAGILAKNRKELTITDMFRETRKVMTELRKISMEL